MRYLGFRLLDYYIIKKFLGTFFYAIIIMVFITTVFDLSEHIDDFFEHNVSFQEVLFDYYLNFIPYFMILISSLLTFISVIYFTSKLAYNTEIIAILSNGVSFIRLLYPYFVSACIIALLSFLISNYYLPYANKTRLAFADNYFHSRAVRFDDRNVHKQILPGVIIYMESYINTSNTGLKFSMEKYENGKLVSKLMSDYIRWDSTKNKWTIKNYYIRTIQGMVEKVESGYSLDTTLNIYPSDFSRREESFAETMSLGQLNKFIDKLRLQGSEIVDLYQVERNKRIAYPLSTFILTFIGVALSSRKIRGGIGLQIGLGLGLSFAYILFMQFTSQFAIGGSLPPVLAAWIPNIIFIAVCVFLYRFAPK